MASLRSVSVDASARARRWDAIVVGSGVAALVAAARLGMRELRVLVLEEAGAGDEPPSLREPALFAGGGEGSVLDTVLRELRVPLIDRRRFAASPIAHQIVGPELRLDVGDRVRTASELVTWGLAKPDEAAGLIEALDAAALQEREALLASPIVRSGGFRALRRSAGALTAGRSERGLPPEVATVEPLLGRVLAAQVRAVGAHCGEGPTSEACARALGAVLRGGIALEPEAGGLVAVLRRRVEALYGEFRSPRGPFELVATGGMPGLLQPETNELWLGRGMLIGASPVALAHALEAPPVVRQLGAQGTSARRRTALRWQMPREALPEGMAERVILMTRPEASDPQQGVATLSVHAATRRSREVELIVRTLADEGAALPADGAPRTCDEDAVRRRIEPSLRELMPFAEDALQPLPGPRVAWDDDDWLDDRPAGREWPGDASHRVSTRPAVYRLDRPAVAGLGLEGELLLGWRTGDAIAAELA